MADPDTSLLLVTTAAGHEGACRRELQRLVPDARAEHLFLKGNLLLHSPLGHDETVAILDEAETELVARVIPVDLRVKIGAGREHLKTLCEAAATLRKIGPGDSFLARCQRRGQHEFSSREVAVTVGGSFADLVQARVDFEEPEWLLAIEIFQDIAFLGLFPAHLFLRKELKRTRKYAPGQRPLNRAQLKLEEIIARFGLELSGDMRALDLGAAPGGWSKVLARHVREVVAVDPAELDPEVLALPQVTHWAVRAEELLTRPDLAQFDLIANDMNRDPDRSARLMCDLASALASGGLAIMTIKFVTRQRRQHIREATEILERAYTDIRVRKMPHNSRETTAVMRRR
jgi:tRNA(Ser,Leu) C12 N-acetylase TAN1